MREDALLAAIHWPEDGYRLFEIAIFAGSCVGGWFRPIGESNAVFICRDAYIRLGGFDERFDLPGGGFVNLDFFRRAVLREGSELVVLLGEGTFHQLHGGIATNTGDEGGATRLPAPMGGSVQGIAGRGFQCAWKAPHLSGRNIARRAAVPLLVHSACWGNSRQVIINHQGVWSGFAAVYN